MWPPEKFSSQLLNWWLLWLRVHARLAEREVTSGAVVGTRDWSCTDLF